MSTFDGFVPGERPPDVAFLMARVSRYHKNPHRKPPLAAFLSHVHTDHLCGLESLKAPFVYCSAVTRKLLLRIEKYPNRMNFARGILETRLQHYRHLKNLLKPIPLGVPTTIELGPNRSVQVTLFDANHCLGAVMFLVEGQGKAILYTGDIRSERWWVENLQRHPIMLPYVHGHRQLDKIYLDTSFVTRQYLDRNFQSKSEGMQLLLRQALQYPEDTKFHFHAWTLGYEDVLRALSHALNSKIHVDRYKLGLLAASSELPAFSGFSFGNGYQPGCLTGDEKVRFHSCEHGTGCPVLTSAETVHITPAICHGPQGEILVEPALGRYGDRTTEIELDGADVAQRLVSLCRSEISDITTQADVVQRVQTAVKSKEKVLVLQGLDTTKTISLQDVVKALSHQTGRNLPHQADSLLPKRITFPYSRHSSYQELCILVSALRPKDVFPCTFEMREWTEDLSMRHLFGSFCDGQHFCYDEAARNHVLAQSPHEMKIDVCPDKEAAALRLGFLAEVEREIRAHNDEPPDDSSCGDNEPAQSATCSPLKVSQDSQHSVPDSLLDSQDCERAFEAPAHTKRAKLERRRTAYRATRQSLQDGSFCDILDSFSHEGRHIEEQL